MLRRTAGLGEVAEGGGFGFERWDGLDEARDGKRVADAARAADQAQDAAFTGQLDGDAHQRRNARAVNLGNAIQDDYDPFRTLLDDGLKSRVELIAGLSDGEAAMDFENGHPAGLADVNFHGGAFGHG